MAALLMAALLAGAEAPGPVFSAAADAAPLFAAGALGRAVADLGAGRFEEAARAFAASQRPEARYLEALALLGAGRAEEAASSLVGLELALPDLADRLALLRGKALERAGRPAEAAEAYALVGPGALQHPEALLARARLLAGLGDPSGALQALEPVAGLAAPEDVARLDAAAEALLLAARLRAGGGPDRDLVRARADLVQCWAGHPLSPAAARCGEALRSLPPPHGAAPPVADALRRAEALLDANRNRAAIAELKSLAGALGPPGPAAEEACRAHLALGRAYRKERRYPGAIELLAPAVAACPGAPARSRSLHALAAAAAAAAPDEAIERYRQLAREYPDGPLADDALYYAADLLARAGRVAEARTALVDLAERYPKGDFRPEALFRSAWLAWRAGASAEALALLERAQREYEDADPYEFARAAYWRARVLAARGRKGDAAGAAALWTMLVERHPADYYGLLARARLGERRGGARPWRRPGGPPGDFRHDPGRLPAESRFRAGVLLLRLGQDRAAADELRALDRALIVPAPPHGAGPLLLVAELLHRAGDHRAAHNLVRTLGRSLLRQRPEGTALRAWRIAYPPAWRDEVERWAPPAGVPTDLLQAIMREESALDPAAVSAAGAVGLTQLMLSTAQELARRARIGRTLTAADLMDGPLNIRLGAAYLGDVLRRFGGSAPLAVAAYNAGDRAVRGWLRERGGLPLDEFVEEIPVQETRGYVKRVLRSYAAYRLLYGLPGEVPVALGQRLPAPRQPRPRTRVHSSRSAGMYVSRHARRRRPRPQPRLPAGARHIGAARLLAPLPGRRQGRRRAVPAFRLRELERAVGGRPPRRGGHGGAPHPRAARHRAPGLRAPAQGAGALLPVQHLRTRREHLPVLREPLRARRSEPRPRRSALPRRVHHLGERRLLLRRLQPAQGRTHARRGGDAPPPFPGAAALDAHVPLGGAPGSPPGVETVPVARRRRLLEHRASGLKPLSG
jgi:soluble lytic murein transglycosylase